MLLTLNGRKIRFHARNKAFPRKVCDHADSWCSIVCCSCCLGVARLLCLRAKQTESHFFFHLFSTIFGVTRVSRLFSHWIISDIFTHTSPLPMNSPSLTPALVSLLFLFIWLIWHLIAQYPFINKLSNCGVSHDAFCFFCVCFPLTQMFSSFFFSFVSIRRLRRRGCTNRRCDQSEC